ncbi:MAG: hypothetical protein O6852_00370 [Gammaproteobacteria bacterium]|jgi:aryl-alcohol dehydrogenase-like predicted oxidoreductase|nr:hypothetical protein [Gammaproteobacteria bacterium]
MGTRIAFDVSINNNAIQERTKVYRHFFESGGAMIDSSPTYSLSEMILANV